MTMETSEYNCQERGHLPIFDSVNNRNVCELCGKVLTQYEDEEE
jgi:hypothetical protein